MKRILSLDGGGVRGALTVGYLKKIETELRQQYGANYKLCDYYDLIGGTSTGSFIAAALAIGKDADELKELYFNLSEDVFPKKGNLTKTIRQLFKGAAYDHKPLERHLKEQFGSIKCFFRLLSKIIYSVITVIYINIISNFNLSLIF